MAMKILLWVSAIVSWLVAAVFIGAYLCVLWSDVRLALSFASAWDRALRPSGERVWEKPEHRAFLWKRFKDFRVGIEFRCTFDDGTIWDSEKERR